MISDVPKFVSDWSDAWNAHDLDRVLAHFHEAVVFTSPIAAILAPRTAGVIHGRDALRSYWAEGLRRIPDLNFNVSRFFVGADSVLIVYHNQRGTEVGEFLRFRGRLVSEGHATYSGDGVNPSGLSPS